MQYSVYPISMAMFNQKLENCVSVQHVKNSFAFLPSDNTPLILAVFIKYTEYLIHSYEDLNFKNWGFFLKKIQQIFPDELENLHLKLLQEKVLLKFRELYPHLSKIGTVVKEHEEQSNDFGSELNLLENILKKSIEKRIEDVLEIEKAIKVEDKAKVLQLSLNFLIVESDLIKHLSAVTEAALKAFTFQAGIQQGSDRVIKLTASSLMPLFEIPARLENSDEFSFWLQLSPFIDLSFDGDQLFASINVTKKEINFEQFKIFRNFLQYHKISS
ncbi:MAG: hypothetical protein H0T62_13605 [Parachlamydiaceae bacterium]|nr:hypothetical protein [Parachlamydiaceae bacterium]